MFLNESKESKDVGGMWQQDGKQKEQEEDNRGGEGAAAGASRRASGMKMSWFPGFRQAASFHCFCVCF